MYNLPFFPQFHSKYRMNYPQNIYNNPNLNKRPPNASDVYHNQNNVNPNRFNSRAKTFTYNHQNYSSNCISTNNLNNDKNSDDNNYFDIFGIKLSSDDILLICLIFFLYTEGVKDDFLFIALVLLLIS